MDSIDIPAWWASLSNEHRIIVGATSLLGSLFLLLLLVLPAILAWGGMITAIIGLGMHFWDVTQKDRSFMSPNSMPQFLMMIGCTCSVLGTVLSWLF